MSELASYSIQATILAVAALVAVSRSRKTDLYQFVLIAIWLVGVIAIYAQYGEDQDVFYSNDQQFHLQVIENLIPNFGVKVGSIISQRYLITVPVFIISQLGINSLLLFKFIQLTSVLILYLRVKTYFKQNQLQLEFQYLPFFCGGLFIFMSLLGLRDTVLATATLYYVFPTNRLTRNSALITTALLRPHLAVALLFGRFFSLLYFKLKSDLDVLKKALFVLLSYAIGSICYILADYILSGKPLSLNLSMFAAKPLSQIALNFVGMQFLVLDGQGSGTVEASTMILIFARLIFIETFTVPLFFIYFFFQRGRWFQIKMIEIGTGLFFFYGLILQNAISTNSTRQNLPFLAVMGFAVVAEAAMQNKFNRANKSISEFQLST